MNDSDLIFISYAKEDSAMAERLHSELSDRGLNAWIDKKNIAPGANWKIEISRAIVRARYFCLLISERSVNKRGYVQREIKEGLSVMQELPTGSIYIVPIRLDDTTPIDAELNNLNWVDLFPTFAPGLKRIISLLESSRPKQPEQFTQVTIDTIKVEFIDHCAHHLPEIEELLGEEVRPHGGMPMSGAEFIQQLLFRLPRNSYELAATSHYLTIRTTHSRVRIGEDLLEKYPEEMQIALRGTHKDLTIRKRGFTIFLPFDGGKWRTLIISYDSIIRLYVPEIGVGVLFGLRPAEPTPPKEKTDA